MGQNVKRARGIGHPTDRKRDGKTGKASDGQRLSRRAAKTVAEALGLPLSPDYNTPPSDEDILL